MLRIKFIVIFLFVLLSLLSIYLLQFSGKLIDSTNSELSDVESVTTRNLVFGQDLYQSSSLDSTSKQAEPNYQITFPKDHSAHFDFDIEWWYLTSILQGDNKQQYSLQWTLFRFRNPNYDESDHTGINNPWNNEHIYVAHASVHSKDQHWFAEKLARGDVGNAGVQEQPFSAFLDNWRWSNNDEKNSRALLPATLEFDIPLINTNDESSDILYVNLRLESTGPFILHGQKGYSMKSPLSKHASHYYSNPYITVNGSLSKHKENLEKKVQVTGTAWFDHEWTSSLLDKTTLGWDWLSLHLDDNSKLMVFRMRLSDQRDYFSGTFVDKTGVVTNLQSSDIIFEPSKFETVNNIELPLQWNLAIKQFNIELNISTLKNEQWNPGIFNYYEGMVRATGSATGEGFLELTGY